MRPATAYTWRCIDVQWRTKPVPDTFIILINVSSNIMEQKHPSDKHDVYHQTRPGTSRHCVGRLTRFTPSVSMSAHQFLS